MRTKIQCSEKVAKEIAEAVATAMCGHAPDKLSPEAQRVYRKMKKLDFEVDLVPTLKSPKDER